MMFVICQLKFEHLKMRKPMALPIGFLIFKCPNFNLQITNITQDIYWQCHWFSHVQMLKFVLTNHKHHTRHLLAIPINVLCDVCDLSIKI
jgi:hypothetical protein